MRAGFAPMFCLLAASLALATPPDPPDAPAPPAPVSPTPARAWFGVFFGDAVDGGVQILEVVPNGPAAKAGIASGDLVIRVDGVDVADREDLARAIERRGPGEAVALTILRQGAPKDARVVLGRRPAGEWTLPRIRVVPLPDEEPPRVPELLGIEITEIPVELRKHLGGSEDAGVLVSRVSPDGASAKALRVGDLLLSVGGTPVGSEDDLAEAVLARSSGPMPVSGRRGKQAFTAEIGLRVKSAEERALQQRARVLEETIRQLEARLAELKRELATLPASR